MQQAQKQAEDELKAQQARIAIDIVQQRDQRLLNFLGYLSIENQAIEQIERFLAQENQSLNQATVNSKSLDLGLEEEGLNKLKYLLESELPQEEKLVGQSVTRLTSLQESIESLERQIAVAASPEDYQKLEESVKETQHELFQAKTNYENAQRKLETTQKNIVKIKKGINNLQ